MTTARWLGLARREFKGSAGRLVFFTACLSVGVAAVVAVAGLSRALDRSIQEQARELLAADIVVSSRRPIAPEILSAIDGIDRALRLDVRELPTVVSVPDPDGSPGGSLLCELKAVGEGYPYYGDLIVDPPSAIRSLSEDGILVGRELLVRLGLAVGDSLRVGETELGITGVIEAEPDRFGGSFTIGPRVLVSNESLDRSGLTGLGSRVSHRVMIRLPDGATAEETADAAEIIKAAAPEPEFVRTETYAEAQPALRRGLDRVGRFLGLVALLSLLIGGIGVAQAVRAWLAGRLDAIAVLKAVGMRPREVFALYLGQTAALAFAGSLGGALVGVLVARAVPQFLGETLPVAVEVGWQPVAVLRGVILGVGVAALFAMRPLVDVLKVPPIRVLRREAEPLPISLGLAAALAAVLGVGVAITAAVQSASMLRGLQFAVGIAVAAFFLSVGAWLVIRMAGAVPRDLGSISLRHGLAALARPGSGTLGAVVALGLGVLTVLGMYLIQGRLTAQLDAELPDEAPTAFLVDIQPEQWPGVRAILEETGGRDLQSVEVVMARLQAINSVPVADLVATADEGTEDRRWVLTREQRLTSMEELPEDNEIIDGALWSMPDRAEVSIERDFAEDLAVGVGDTVTLNIQGVPLELVVSSLRSVDWSRFSINFFLVVEPGVLDGVPGFRIATVRLPEDQEIPAQDRLAAAYPNVTVLRVREVLQRVVAVMRQLGFGIRFIGSFTVLAGVAILAGAVAAGAVRRSRQVALYKTLGMTRAQVAAVFAVEYALIGLVAGVIGTVGGVALAWIVTRFGFQIAWAWAPGALAVSVASATFLSVVAGLSASTRALAVRPLSVLRQGE